MEGRERVEDSSGRLALAVDIGGTKLAVGVVDSEGRVLETLRTATPHSVDPDGGEGMFRTVMSLIGQLKSLPAQTGGSGGSGGSGGGEQIAGVGVGCGGPMRWPQGEVSPLNIPAWRGFPLRARLADAFPGLPVRLRNDAMCVAAAEHWRGAGQQSTNMLGMVVSTGVGGGLILDGKLIDGRTGNAGHIGHVIVHEEEPLCRCGAVGCLEAVASGPRLTSWASDRGWREGLPPEQRTGVDLADDARRGHPIAVAALRRAGRALGIAIASVATLCDLEVVAIGGGFSQAASLLFDPLHTTLRERIGLDYARGIRVVPAGLGQEAGLIGAAAMIFRPELYWSVAEL
jgi:glucokinase